MDEDTEQALEPGKSVSRTMLESVMRVENINQMQVAKAIGWSGQKLSRKLVKDTMYLDEMVDILDKLGYDLVPWNRKNGVIPSKLRLGRGQRIRQMIHGEIFDTADSCAIADDFYTSSPDSIYTDGIGRELFVSPSRKYFFAKYYEDPEIPPCIEIVPMATAKAFADKYADSPFNILTS